jgi:hypothetical protein
MLMKFISVFAFADPEIYVNHNSTDYQGKNCQAQDI